MLEEEERLTLVDIIVSQSDLEGSIIYANPIFYRVSGYPYGKLIGANHNIVRHPEMPKTIFKSLWKQLKEKQEVYCFIKNQSKENKYYWVFAYIRPSLNKDGSLRNYISIRRTISNKARAIIEPFYKQLLSVENTNGIQASEKMLKNFMEQNRYKNQTNNEIIHNIQY